MRSPTSRQLLTPYDEDVEPSPSGKPTPRKYAACRKGECIAPGCREQRVGGIKFLDPTNRHRYTVGFCDRHSGEP